MSIEWEAPHECPDHATVMARVKHFAGDVAVPRTLSASAQIRKQDGRYHAQLHVETTNGSGERALEHTNCAVLADSVALVIALSATERGRMNQPAQLQVALSLHAAAVSGYLPQIALGLGGAVALQGPWALRAELGGIVLLPQDKYFPSMPGIGASFRMIALGARLCRAWSAGRFDFAPCLGVQLTRLAANGFGGARTADGIALTTAPTASLSARLRLWKHLGLRLTLEAAVPLERRRFVYDDLGLLHQPSRLAGQLFVASEVVF
jgi:hypothetical protein